MAFKTIGAEKTEGDALYTTKLDVGASYVGFPIERRVKEDDKRKANLVLQLEDGTKKLIFTSGNAAYAAADEKLKLGVLTKITRLPDGTTTNSQTKKVMKSTKFEIQQDEDITITTSGVVDSENIPDLGKAPEPKPSTAAERAAEIARAAAKKRN